MTSRVFVASAVLLVLAASAPAQDRFMPGRLSPEVQAALNANTDILGEQVLAGGEPSFERVAPIFPPLGRPRANVGVAEHRDEIGIGWDGTIELARKVAFRVGDPPSPHGFDGPIGQSLLDGYLPVLITRWRYEGLEYELTVFGHSPGMSPTAQTDAYAALTIANPSNEARTAQVTVYSVPALGGPLPRFRSDVPPAGRNTLHFRIPWPVNADKLVEPIGKDEYDTKLGEVRSFWKTLLDRARLFETPEGRVNDAALAWLMYNFLNVDTVDGRCEPHDGGRFYEEVYGYSAALYCHALTQFGYFQHAERYLKDLLVFQKPDGQIRTSYGTPDNGAMLYAIGQHYRMSRNGEWFIEFRKSNESEMPIYDA